MFVLSLACTDVRNFSLEDTWFLAGPSPQIKVPWQLVVTPSRSAVRPTVTQSSSCISKRLPFLYTGVCPPQCTDVHSWFYSYATLSHSHVCAFRGSWFHVAMLVCVHTASPAVICIRQSTVMHPELLDMVSMYEATMLGKLWYINFVRVLGVLR